MADEQQNGGAVDELQKAEELSGEVIEENNTEKDSSDMTPGEKKALRKKKRPEKKKNRPTRQERKARRKEEKRQTFLEFKEGFRTIYKNRYILMGWLGICVLLAFLSMPFTTWTSGSNSGSHLIVFNLATRMCSLFALTLFGAFTPYRKSVFAGGAAVWMTWMLLLSNVSFLWPVIVFALAATVFAFVLRYELKAKQDRPVPNDTWSDVRGWVRYFYFSIALVFAIELLHNFRVKAPLFNLGKPFVMFITDPDRFMNNVIIVFLTGIWTRICRRRKLVTTIFVIAWLALAFASLQKINKVYEPLMLLDIYATADMNAVITKYYSTFFFVAIGIAIFLAIVGIGVLIGMEKPKPVRGINLTVAGFLTVVLLVSFVETARLPYAKFSASHEIVNYQNQGFAASFMRTLVGSVKRRPENYTEQEYKDVYDVVRKEYVSKTDLGVKNIIVIQMESFSDPKEYTDRNPELKLEYNPIPFMTYLEENYSTGALGVKVYGGQTVKSEFEFLTGIDLANLPKGLNPYVTTLKDSKINSLPRYLSSLGFATTAIHNYQGEFYSRMYVYESLGFDRFVPMETMNGVKRRNDELWAADEILEKYIARTLDENEDRRNFIFISTVQLHGSYPVLKPEEYVMQIDGLPAESEIEGEFQYYVGQLIEFDKAMKSIIGMLETRGEPTVVVMYSDHLPGIARELCDFEEEDVFFTRYYIWSNLEEIAKEDEDLPVYRLSTAMFDKIGLDGDLINRFHDVYSGKDEAVYRRASEIIDYNLAYEGDDLYDDGVSIVYGFDTQEIVSVTKEHDGVMGIYRVKAKNLTDNTEITVNGKSYKLVRRTADEALFTMATEELSPGDVLTLRIVGERVGFVYTESAPFIFE